MIPHEEPIRWDAAARQLVGVLHHPASGRPRPVGAVLVVHPFAEEKKFSHRVLVRLSRELARRDVASLRFDLSGCGDSFGDSRDATLAHWRDEIDAAREQLAARFPDVPQVLMGLRLGATLALAAAAQTSPPPSPRLQRASPPALVLWEPVISGRKYVDEILRRRMIKEMMTTGKKATGREQVLAQLETDGYLDLDGIAVGRSLIEEVATLDAGTFAATFTGKALCVQIAFNAKVSAALDALAETLRAAGARAETVGIREQVIWDRVELVEGEELIRTSADWIASLTHDG
ncbi:MAG TPA: alpha/beta hydrolase [Planctomycetota bacterium]|nr:alpha/beta hydrolase [Planctomycetota bacterium]